jgi:hypothetical protein
MTKDEALKLALEALENIEKIRVYEDRAKHLPSLEDKAITAIKEALAQSEQEPVAWVGDISEDSPLILEAPTMWQAAPLYTTPPKRKPLTDQRINEVYQEATCQSLRPQDYKLVREFARAIEAAHDIKELLK